MYVSTKRQDKTYLVISCLFC